MAEIIGTPMPAMMRVVQIEPAPMPTLTRVDAELDQRLGGLAGGDVAGDQVDVGEGAADARDDVEDALRVAVRGVDDQDVGVRGDQRGGAIERVASHADGGADAQPARARPCRRSGTSSPSGCP